MKSKKIISLISAIALTASLVLAFPVGVCAANRNESDPVKGTQTAKPEHFVEANISTSNNTINYGDLDIFTQTKNNNRNLPLGTDKHVQFTSDTDLTSAQSIKYNEGATNSNAFYKVTTTGETYPTGGLDNTEWLYYRDTNASATGYVQPTITGNITSAGLTGLTLPTGYTGIGGFSKPLTYYSVSGSALVRHTDTVYVALLQKTDDSTTHVYVGTTNDLSNTTTTVFFDKEGEAKAPTFSQGNSYVLATMPTGTSTNSTTTINFGSYVQWDSTQGNANSGVYTLIDMPTHAITEHTWTWTVNITGEYSPTP